MFKGGKSLSTKQSVQLSRLTGEAREKFIREVLAGMARIEQRNQRRQARELLGMVLT